MRQLNEEIGCLDEYFDTEHKLYRD